MIRFLLLFAVISFACNQYSLGQTSQVEFGKNRIQYHQDFEEWLTYESKNFVTYWYGEARYIGQSVVQIAEFDHRSIQNILEHKLNDKIEIIVYKDLTDLKQTNIGSEEAFMNVGGQTKIVENKIFVYFNGNHNHLRKQIRQGIATVYLNSMLFGSNLQEMVQNAVMLNLPSWFKDGLVSYVGERWSTEVDNKMRDYITSNEEIDFEKFSYDYPSLAGHSMWYFISQNYGESNVSSLLYLTRINRSVESGFLYVLGIPFKNACFAWKNYFINRYKSEQQILDIPDLNLLEIKNKRNLPISHISLSPDGKKLLYVTNDIGKYQIYLYDIQSKERKRIMKKGFRNAFQETDYNYPLTAWNPNNQELTIIYEYRDIIYYNRYDFINDKSTTDVIPNQYQRIFSIDYIGVNKLLLSASIKGQSDLFIFNMVGRQTQRLTNDFWDDLDAKSVHLANRNGIIFTSNRIDQQLETRKLDTILPIENYNLYFLDLGSKDQELVKVTNTPLANEKSPFAIDSTWFGFLSDETGVYNRQIGYLDSFIAYYNQHIKLVDSSEIILHQDSIPVDLDSSMIANIQLIPVHKLKAINFNQTNYDRGIKQLVSAKKTSLGAGIIVRNNKHVIFTFQPDLTASTVAQPTFHHQHRLKTFYLGKKIQSNDIIPNVNTRLNPTEIISNEDQSPEVINDTIPPTEPKNEEIIIEDYLFQSEFDDEDSQTTIVVEDTQSTVIEQNKANSTGAPLNLNTGAIALEEENANKGVHRFRGARITPYRLKFRTDFFTTKLDNNLLFGGLENFTAGQQTSYPPPGILLKANFKDLFEDYEVEGGVRIPLTFRGAEYFLLFDNKKKRLDKRIAFYRSSMRETSNQQQTSITAPRHRNIILLGQYQLRYPLDIFRSFRGTFTIRGDKRIQLATDPATLEVPTINTQRAGIRLEYVFDNTLNRAINIRWGTRYKVFVEGVKRFQLDVTDDFQFSVNDGAMGIIGFDARHYQRLDKFSILAIRAAGTTSFGTEKILYYLGGTDNWLFSSFNTTIPFPTEGNFAYQTFATNLRGFRNNIRNGNSFALINAELRIPVFNYFSKQISSSFLRNFQAVGFFDVGTAWQGKSPFGSNNPLNTVFLEENNVRLKVNYFRDPIVAGYGIGLRTMLFGYFVRVDYGWGIETRVVQEPRFYLSIGTDF